jgi:hypothetical protein
MKIQIGERLELRSAWLVEIYKDGNLSGIVCVTIEEATDSSMTSRDRTGPRQVRRLLW